MFKPGDKVKCINDELCAFIRKDDIYTVASIPSNNRIRVKEAYDCEYNEYRFIPIEQNYETTKVQG